MQTNFIIRIGELNGTGPYYLTKFDKDGKSFWSPFQEDAKRDFKTYFEAEEAAKKIAKESPITAKRGIKIQTICEEA